jgi:hypothetical protein
MKWQKSIEILVSILENPHIEAGYRDLKKYYESNNLSKEAECIQFLINNKFSKNANNSNTSQK